ncbi:MAG: hypothetical protein A2268_08245 [Candidatus Raymondbacteria bacterium RifOxyA12_full_50_37]|nr:MAG: hypothetical protein A2268_08245 [Candidatus Raymondbacteria bacterium RifOxyA12_full_50_37]OGJ93493.1 MAG: hypothetical protein A2248_08955 [Candidatus Raymondbacteria bacterium RIFOXYA2_FULL_49_16]OGP45612.1 MAG: hypothetical protein A2324_04555 [Candidatus Raymondbacteria bacterium RIFOXYB2_FULL_49_35]
MKSINACKPENTSAAKLHASQTGVRKFVKDGFGLTAHWGLYSLGTSGNEWALFNERIPVKKYMERMNEFNPSRFNADEWADLLLEAGAKFFMITSKHHDGFCLWDSDLTDFKVTNSPFKRNILAELAKALNDRGIPLHFYYSLVDWTHSAYKLKKTWNEYIAYYQGQVRELCTRFGKIGGVLFDGYWPRVQFNKHEAEWFGAQGPWDLAGTYDLIHSLQPHAVITNNTHIPPLKGEDYQIWELDLPGENTIGFNSTQVGRKPLACWWNLNSGWSYQPWNHTVKNAEEIHCAYKKARASNAVFFLNVGPRPFGDIHPEEQGVLREIGKMVRE